MWFQYFIHGTVLKEFVCPRAWEVWKKHPVAAVLASIGGSAFFFYIMAVSGQLCVLGGQLGYLTPPKTQN